MHIVRKAAVTRAEQSHQTQSTVQPNEDTQGQRDASRENFELKSYASPPCGRPHDSSTPAKTSLFDSEQGVGGYLSGAEPQSVTECQGYTNKVKTALCLKNIKQPDADAFCNGRQKAIRSGVDPEGRWCENTQRRLLSALSPFGLCPTVGAETR